MRHGPNLEHVMRIESGDFVYIPAGVLHQPYNPGAGPFTPSSREPTPTSRKASSCSKTSSVRQWDRVDLLRACP
jgi:oxalate decarboxylase/phosphoglucose isomerase-like protein (cupin superfamily)